MRRKSKTETVGLSPKVVLPLVTGITVSIVLFITGNDEEAKGVLFSVLGVAGVGIVAPPGRVRQR